MSTEKHQITGILDTDVAYMKYNYTTCECVLGGHSNCIDFIDYISGSFLGKSNPENKHSQNARIRYVYTIKKDKYRQLKTDLLETYADGFIKIDKLDRRL